MRFVVFICFCILFSFGTRASNTGTDSTEQDCWLIPELSKFQFAGNIGFISGGIGYEYANRKMELDLMYGYVPKGMGGTLHTFTVKNTWIPFKSWTAGKNTSVDLLTLGLPISYTFGDQFFFIPPREKYPRRYYDYSSALRIGIFAGGKVRQELGESKAIKELGLYYEVGTYDLLLHNYVFNIGTMRFVDLFNLGLGMQVRFGK